MSKKKNEDGSHSVKKENSERASRVFDTQKDAIDWLGRDRVTLYGSPKDLEPRKPKFRFPWQKEPKEEPSPWGRLADLDPPSVAWDLNETKKDT